MRFLIVVGTLYIAVISIYIFVLPAGELPAIYAGSASFLTEQERELVTRYGKIRNFLFLLELPLEVIFYFVLFFFGIAQNWLRRAEKLTAHRSGQLALFTLIFATTSFLLFLPLRFARYFFAKKFGISVQGMSSWLKDRLLDLSLHTILLFFVIVLLATLLKKSERHWWFYTWCLSVPVVIGIVFVQPVVIDPLYHSFSPLRNAGLERKVLDLAAASGIPSGRVYEVQMADKTNAFNAYVNGIGTNARIVLWDTTLERLDEEEILFITAHEIGHYVEKHVYLGMAGYLLSGLLLLYVTDRALRFALRRRWIPSYENTKTIVLILLIFAMLTLLARPLELAASRYLEGRADRFAVELTGNPEAGIRAFQKMSRVSLNELHPPVIIKWLRYTHPTMAERMAFLESYLHSNRDEEDENDWQSTEF